MSEADSTEFKILDPAAQVIVQLPPIERHPGVFIRDVLLPEYGLDISKLARHLGMNRPNLSEVLSGKREVSRDLAYRLGALMNDAVADLLLSYQLAWDVQQERDRREAFKRDIERLQPVDHGG